MKKQILLVAAILLLGFSIVSAQTPTVPKQISGGVLNGKARNLPAAEFPAAAKAVNAGGEVNVKVTIDENGDVISASAVSGHPLLRAAAEDAARQAKFSPTRLSGQPVKVTGVIIYNFNSSAPPAQSIGIAETTGGGRAISGGVVNGKAQHLAVPAYPAAARAVKAEGAVNVQVVIDENGDVVSASSISGHPLLRAAAEKAARESKFSQTLLQGQPVKVTGIIVYNFIGATNEEKLAIMGLGAFLSIYGSTKQMEEISKEDISDTPQFSAELLPLTQFPKDLSREKRIETVRKTASVIENKVSGADAWQFAFGKSFGKLILEIMKGEKSFNETQIKTDLLEMKNLLYTVPSDFPPDVLGKFKELTNFADVPNLGSDENKSRFSELLFETLNVISPDSTKN